LGCGIVLEVLAGMPGTIGGWAERAATVLTPRQVRAVIATLLGIGITAGLATGASAVGSAPLPLTAPSPVPAQTPDPEVSSLPDPGWVPSIPTVRPQPDVRVLSPVPRDDPADRDSPHEVVVHRGDSLWAIAARHLGTAASDAEIAEAWPDWYAANRHVIGSDPDLLLPGQVLRAPERVGS
jgi:nucleoid-associated protein YgaU